MKSIYGVQELKLCVKDLDLEMHKFILFLKKIVLFFKPQQKLSKLHGIREKYILLI